MHILLLVVLVFSTFAILYAIDCARSDIIKAIRESPQSDYQEKINKIYDKVKAGQAKVQKAVDDNK